jgi:hypothetical protein
MTEIRSYRRVFDLERRVYSIDSLRLNPGGVPVRGIVYLLAILVCALVAAQLPLIGLVVRTMPWYLRDLALPVAAASVLSLLRVDGRTFHLTARSLILFWSGPRRLTRLQRSAPAGRVWRPEQIVLLPDGSDGCMRRLRYRGPGAVLVTCEHERVCTRTAGIGRWARSGLLLRASGQGKPLKEGKVIVLAPQGRLRVHGSPVGRSGG